ncbi:MAG TPA: bifunctional 2-C-methyl-D-erythritol 4-phosphate cytidylyltransferase/2-C-methyl-D-erythritol 2,4-cyclodiphosphate synthase [Terriglobia bacterium]|nr:bifunctional 2-C-methyl-D-erythritol 4-phosphate cytidylyltransferase/2-C-methyl-D-erythritol 2,4-cyclodiphosphate synthase [Terriglobia bacterium]
MTKAIALIVAAGSGLRIGGEVPKQFLHLAGKPLLRYCLETFLAHPRISGVCVVINPSYRPFYDAAAAGLPLMPAVNGGATRQESVRLGLESLTSQQPDLVLIHDAARPFLDAATIDRTLDALDQHQAALVAVPVVDTLKRAADGFSGQTVDRKDLWRAQTPQGFRFISILAAHRAVADSGKEMTDDAAVAEAAGQRVMLVEGHEDNFKVTTPADLARAERMLQATMPPATTQDQRAYEYRTGNGFDVHRLLAGDGVHLCGVKIPCEWRLEGHSDADVALHALTDAILGAISAKDIGAHFPPSDPQWRGAESWKFLDHANKLVHQRSGKIVHCDVTIICEKPKVGPHRDAMVARIAEILRIEPDRVSVKATTTEKLGFTGRGEGIAAQATATVALPAR